MTWSGDKVIQVARVQLAICCHPMAVDAEKIRGRMSSNGLRAAWTAAMVRSRRRRVGMCTAADNTGPGTNPSEIDDVEVMEAIHRLLPCNPSIQDIARSLSMNVRALQRRLAKGSINYRQLLDQCRHQQAKLELERRVLTIAEISQQLGYSDPCHFVRAFRRWTAQAPTQFRARVRALDGL